MALTKKQLKSAALALAPGERKILAEELLLSIDGAQRDAIDTTSLDEVRRREQAFAAGQTQAKPVDDVIQRLRNKGSRS